MNILLNQESSLSPSPSSLRIKDFRGTGVAQMMEHVILGLGVVSLSPKSGVEITKKIKK